MSDITMIGRSVSNPFRRRGRLSFVATVRWDGEGYQVSLNTRDERKAGMKAAALRLKVEAGEWEPPQVKAATTLKALAADYRRWYVTGLGEAHVADREASFRSDGSQLDALVAWLEARGRKTIEKVSALDVRAFVDERRQRGSLETTRRIVRIAKAAWNWAIDHELAKVNPWLGGLGLPRRKLADPRNLSDLELARLLAFAPTWRHPAIWEYAACSLYAGLRIGEAEAIRVEDLDDQAGLIRVRPFKHHGARDTLYPLELRAILAGRCAAARERVAEGGLGHLFPEASEGWGKRVKNLLVAAGIADASAHDLRRTFAGLLARRGVPTTRIRDYLGHTSCATTEGYYVGRTEAVPGDGELLSLRRPRGRGRRGVGDAVGDAPRRRRGSAS